ncbi:response regulator [Propionibacteriaceae bacterium Y1685]|uniref:response regulator n=1 Tax=Microlunatus sp. Y1700 TaxID=3418487 RepID=UPI003B801B51
MTTVLLVDDDPLVCRGVAMILSSDPDLEVIGEVRDGSEALAAVQRLGPDVVLMDARMPGMDGLQATRELKAQQSPPKVLMLTTWDHDEVAERAVLAGADGFLLKDSSPQDLIAGVHQVSRGETAVSPRTARRIFSLLRSGRGTADQSSLRRLEDLTVKEREIAVLVASGLSNAEIATRTFTSQTTVKSQLASVITKLGVRNRTDVTRIVTRAGLVDD